MMGGYGGFGGFNPMMGGYGGFDGGYGGGFDQRGPGNDYARPFPGLQPQPARLPPPTQPTPIPPPGMEANPDYIPPGKYGPAVGDTSRPFRPIDRSPPPGMELNPAYRGDLPPDMAGQAGGIESMKYRPIQAQQPQMAQRYNPNVYDPRAEALRQMQQQFQQREANTTDYQRLMDRQRMASMPRSPSPPNMSGGLGLNPMPVNAPSDFEIASSLGFKDPNAGWWMTTDVKPTSEYEKMGQQRNTSAKAYLDSIGYGQSGFDPSKYEVKKQPSTSFSMADLFRGVRGLA